ncbi:MAG: N-formylglutamate amidohydrolase [Alphaproteobacteria bacterium]
MPPSTSLDDGLLQPDEPPPVTVVNEAGAGRCLLLCDHAANRIPATLNGLGLSDDERARHIAWDIGALDLARRLSRQLDWPLVHSNYSRLVVDLNRPPQAPDLMAAHADGTIVAGNLDINAWERSRRLTQLFQPYHAAIEALLDARRWRGLVSLHSFTPAMNGQVRPWHIGVGALAASDWAARLTASLRAASALVIGQNVPYRIDVENDYAVPVHGDGRDLPAVLIEVRQDLLCDETQAAAAADALTHALRDCPPNLASK